VLARALVRVQELFDGGETSADRLRVEMHSVVSEEPLASVEYVSVADLETLDEQALAGSGSLVSMAVRIGRTRLIDNVILGVTPSLRKIVNHASGLTR